MRRFFVSLALCVLMISGCGNDSRTSNKQQSVEVQGEHGSGSPQIDVEEKETTSISQESDTDIYYYNPQNEDNNNDGLYTDIDDFYININENEIGFGGYSDCSEFAYLKSADENQDSMDFTAYGSNTHWLRLVNNSSDDILITRAYVSVLDYQPVEYDDYVVNRAGAGDAFDPSLELYAEVDSPEEEYIACIITNNENGDTVRDSVINWSIPSNAGINIIYNVDFLKTGIYKYRLNVEYEYNNHFYPVSVDNSVLYDDIDEYSIEEKIAEYSELYPD